MTKWRVKFSTGGGPFPPYDLEITRPDAETEQEVLVFCNNYQRITGSYYVAVSAILVEEDSTSGK